MYSEDTYGKDISLPTGSVPNKFIFARPTLLAPIFKAIGIRLPVDMIQYLKEVSDEFRATRTVQPIVPRLQEVTQVVPMAREESRTPLFGEPAVLPGPGAGPGTPQYGPGTPSQSPAFRVNGNSPPFLVDRESPVKLSELNAKVQKLIDDGVTKDTVMGGYGQPYNPYGLTPEQQAAFFAAANQAKRGGRRVTGRKTKTSVTRKRSNDPIKRYAQTFSSLWKMYAKGKKT
jgi:hypothetical protein